LNQIQDNPNPDFIDFLTYRFPEIIPIFFDILLGNKILINESTLDQIYDTISFLEFSSISILSFFQNSSFSFIFKSVSQLSTLPIKSNEEIIFSHFLHLRNENQIFEFIQNQVKEKKDYLSFLKLVYFGFVDSYDLLNLINFIQLTEIDFSLFKYLKSEFLSNYSLSFSHQMGFKDKQTVLSFTDIIQEYIKADKKN
jgi:hypothetical protein